MNPHAMEYSAAERAKFLARFNPNHRHDFHLLVRRRDAFELGDSRSSASYAHILPAFEAVLQKLKNGVPKYPSPICPGCGRGHAVPRIEIWYFVMTDLEVVLERHCYVLSIQHAIARMESGITKLKELAHSELKSCRVCGRWRKQVRPF